MRAKKHIPSLIMNFLIVIFVTVGFVVVMMPKKSPEGAVLAAKGLQNLRYYTVLSNLFCGIISLLWIVSELRGRRFSALLKLMAAAAVSLTFSVVAFFLAPMNPGLNLYQDGNLWFHLIVPVTAMIEFLILDTEKVPLKKTLLTALPVLGYGVGYLINILINGIGKWPDSNDWYGFLNWGYPVGILIMVFAFLINWGIACLMQLLNQSFRKLSAKLRAGSSGRKTDGE